MAYSPNGRFSHRHTARNASKPYNRPPTAIRGVRGGGLVTDERGGWMSTILDPASRLIVNGSAKLFGFLFHKRRTLPLEPGEYSGAGAVVSQDTSTVPLSETRSRKIHDGGSKVDIQKNSSDCSLGELVQLFKQRSFTMAEFNRLERLLLSRTVESSNANHENSIDKKGKTVAVASDDLPGSSHPLSTKVAGKFLSTKVAGKAATPSMRDNMVEESSLLQNPAFSGTSSESPEANGVVSSTTLSSKNIEPVYSGMDFLQANGVSSTTLPSKDTTKHAPMIEINSPSCSHCCSCSKKITNTGFRLRAPEFDLDGDEEGNTNDLSTPSTSFPSDSATKIYEQNDSNSKTSTEKFLSSSIFSWKGEKKYIMRPVVTGKDEFSFPIASIHPLSLSHLSNHSNYLTN